MKKNNLFLIVSLCLMAASSIGLFLNSLGVFFTPIAESLNEKRGSVALFSTIIIFANASGSILLSRLATNRNYRKIYLGGVVGTMVSLIIMANAQSLVMLYGGSLVLGFSMCTYFMVIITTIINCSFKENVGTITGIVMSFSGLAGALFSPLFASIIRSWGWRMGFYVMAVVAVALCLPGLFAEMKVEREQSEFRNGEKIKFNYLSASVIFCMLMSACYMAIATLPQHFTGLAASRGFSAAIGPLLVSASMIGNIVSKLIAGALADRLGGLKTMAVMFLSNLAGIILLLVSGNTAVSLAGAFLFGAIFANSAVVLSIFCRELFGLDDYRKVYPAVVFAGNVANALTISAIGYIYDYTSSYDPALILTAVLALGGILLAVLANRVQPK